MGVAVTGLSAGSAVDTRHFQSLRRRSEAGKRREEGMAEDGLPRPPAPAPSTRHCRCPCRSKRRRRGEAVVRWSRGVGVVSSFDTSNFKSTRHVTISCSSLLFFSSNLRRVRRNQIKSNPSPPSPPGDSGSRISGEGGPRDPSRPRLN